MLASTGVFLASASKRARSRATPARRATAMRWTSALVEPPRARTVVTALSMARASTMSRILRSSHTMSTMRLPVSVAICAWRESGAGMEAAPGSVSPRASAALVIVEAVPIVMQWPGDRAMPLSTSCQSSSVMLPARSSAQYFQLSLPLPRTPPRKSPRSIGPAGTKIDGRFMESAPMTSAGVVLSHPPMSTQPSTG